ncbi:DUF883 family protein [Salipiger sp.]|uniref:DUF883 family protein n=1 Tax=Salipiger sp. TaxID=2078585 RepID=UPI003A96D7BA
MAQAASKIPTDISPKTETRDVDALSEQIATLRSDVSHLAELIGDIGTRKGREVRDRAEEKVQEARNAGEDALRQAGAKVSELEAGARDSIRANPLQSIGIAAGVGFLIGYLGSRR